MGNDGNMWTCPEFYWWMFTMFRHVVGIIMHHHLDTLSFWRSLGTVASLLWSSENATSDMKKTWSLHESTRVQTYLHTPRLPFLGHFCSPQWLLPGRHGDLSTRRDITDIVDSAPVVVCLGEVAPKGTVVNLGSNVSHPGLQWCHLHMNVRAGWLGDRIW